MFHQFDSGDLLELLPEQPDRDLRPALRLSQPEGPGGPAQPVAPPLSSRASAPRSGPRTATRSCRRSSPGMAADKDGRLQPEDKIVGIQKENGEEIDLVEKKLNDVVRYIRGPRGTKVRLIVQPEGTKERKVYELTRERIELKEQHAKGKIIEAKDSRRQGLQDRRHQPARLLRRHHGHAPGRPRCRQRDRGLPEDPRGLPQGERRRRRHGPPRQRRRPARGGQDPLGPVHRHGPGRPGQGGPRASSTSTTRTKGWPGTARSSS